MRAPRNWPAPTVAVLFPKWPTTKYPNTLPGAGCPKSANASNAGDRNHGPTRVPTRVPPQCPHATPHHITPTFYPLDVGITCMYDSAQSRTRPWGGARLGTFCWPLRLPQRFESCAVGGPRKYARARCGSPPGHVEPATNAKRCHKHCPAHMASRTRTQLEAGVMRGDVSFDPRQSI